MKLIMGAIVLQNTKQCLSQHVSLSTKTWKMAIHYSLSRQNCWILFMANSTGTTSIGASILLSQPLVVAKIDKTYYMG
jgi:hypothetical protein